MHRISGKSRVGWRVKHSLEEELMGGGGEEMGRFREVRSVGWEFSELEIKRWGLSKHMTHL